VKYRMRLKIWKGSEGVFFLESAGTEIENREE
jgi:hypothetical protein